MAHIDQLVLVIQTHAAQSLIPRLMNLISWFFFLVNQTHTIFNYSDLIE